MFFLPNPGSKTEMAMLGAGMFAFQMVRAAAGVTNIYGIIMWGVAVYLIVVTVACLITLYLVWLAATRIIAIYRRNGLTNSQDARLLWGAAAVFGVMCGIAYWLYLQPDSYAAGLIVFSWSLLAFVLLCEFINWRAGRNQPAPGLPPNVTLQNIVSWHKTVKQQSQP